MTSNLDQNFFLKKDNYLNDSIDRSLVSEHSNKTGTEIATELLTNSLFIILPILNILCIETTNIITFTYFDNKSQDPNKLYLIYYIIVEIYNYFFCGFIFFLGTMKYFESFLNYDKREVRLKAIYYSYSRIFYFFSTLLIILPLCLVSYLILSKIFFPEKINILFWEFYLKYLIFLPVIFFFTLNLQLNYQILKKQNSYIYLLFSNIFLYPILVYIISYLITNKISLITISWILNSFICYIISHRLIKQNIPYLKDINISIVEDIQILKWENFFNFVKLSMIKGVLFNFRYFALGIIIYSSFYIGNEYLLATTLAFLLISLPHIFALGISKFYKSYSESSVFDHSQRTKLKYLQFFWLIVFISANLFSFSILLLKTPMFRIMLNLYTGFFQVVPMDQQTSEIYRLYNIIVKYYSLIILFDFFSNGFQEILKSYNDHSRNYLSFYKGLSLILIFIPIGVLICYFLEYEIFWGYWIGLYGQMIVYSIILFFVLVKTNKKSVIPW